MFELSKEPTSTTELDSMITAARKHLLDAIPQNEPIQTTMASFFNNLPKPEDSIRETDLLGNRNLFKELKAMHTELLGRQMDATKQLNCYISDKVLPRFARTIGI